MSNQDKESYYKHNPSIRNDCSGSGFHVTAHISYSNGLLGTRLSVPGSYQCHVISKNVPTQTAEARKIDRQLVHEWLCQVKKQALPIVSLWMCLDPRSWSISATVYILRLRENGSLKEKQNKKQKYKKKKNKSNQINHPMPPKQQHQPAENRVWATTTIKKITYPTRK